MFIAHEQNQTIIISQIIWEMIGFPLSHESTLQDKVRENVSGLIKFSILQTG